MNDPEEAVPPRKPMTPPRAFHVMAKPTGSACNLDCAYCFFLKKDRLYPGSNFRMSEEVHDSYVRQLFESHQVPHVTVAWQGGEPTLMGLEFFKRSVDVQKQYAKPGTRIENTFQTNGILLDDAWCRFFHDNGFLIGLSIDGPKELHDFYRKDKGGHGTFDQVLRALRLLQKHQVEFNAVLRRVPAAAEGCRVQSGWSPAAPGRRRRRRRPLGAELALAKLFPRRRISRPGELSRQGRFLRRQRGTE